MQTFLPYPDLRASCQVLDTPRLGKQRVETFQVLRALTWPEYAWKNHPAVRMWRGFVPGLVRYGVENCWEWTRRGHADNVLPQLLAWTGGQVPDDPPLPPWFGLVDLHLSHRSALLRKDPARYRPVFGPDDPDDLPYFWPASPFPRWPVRRAGRDLDLAGALGVLGLEAPRTGQAEAVEAVRAGRDCLLVAAPGHGGTTAGLLAGLALPGTTRWVAAPAGAVSYDVPEVALPPARDVPPAEPADRPPPLARPARPSFADEVRRPAPGLSERREPLPSFLPEPPPRPEPPARSEPRPEMRTEPMPPRAPQRNEPMMPRPPLRPSEPPAARTPPLRAPERTAPPPAPALPSVSADKNLADMAHRLEAALRRPGVEGRPDSAEPRIGAPPVAPEAPSGRPSRGDAPAGMPGAGKGGFENLEDEMASLLGRPKTPS